MRGLGTWEGCSSAETPPCSPTKPLQVSRSEHLFRTLRPQGESSWPKAAMRGLGTWEGCSSAETPPCSPTKPLQVSRSEHLLRHSHASSSRSITIPDESPEPELSEWLRSAARGRSHEQHRGAARHHRCQAPTMVPGLPVPSRLRLWRPLCPAPVWSIGSGPGVQPADRRLTLV